MIVVTGATGQLGQLVIENLLKFIPAGEIVATARNPQKAAGLAARGIEVRQADYDRPETLANAFKGANKLLLIPVPEAGRRLAQHRAIIDAVGKAKIGLLAFTSFLHADNSPLPFAAEYKETEKLIGASGIPAVFLRNGWYTENYLASIPAALQYGVLLGSAAEGRIASAARADYAQAAATVLMRDDQAGRIYELAGDESYSLAEFATAIARETGKAVTYQNLPEAEFKKILAEAGLPEWLAALLAESDVGASKGGLFDNGRQLSQLLGRPTTRMEAQVKHAVEQASGKKPDSL